MAASTAPFGWPVALVVRVTAHGVGIEAVPGRRASWVGHLLRSLLTRGAYDILRLWDPKHAYRPRVVVVNKSGQEFLLFSTATLDEALEKRDRVRHELDELPLDVWCDRHVVPGDFVRGDWPP